MCFQDVLDTRVSRTSQIHVTSPNLGFPYFNFLGGGPVKKHPVFVTPIPFHLSSISAAFLLESFLVKSRFEKKRLGGTCGPPCQRGPSPLNMFACITPQLRRAGVSFPSTTELLWKCYLKDEFTQSPLKNKLLASIYGFTERNDVMNECRVPCSRTGREGRTLLSQLAADLSSTGLSATLTPGAQTYQVLASHIIF